MGRWLSQIFELTQFNLLTLPKRTGSAISSMVGIAGVVLVLVGVLSIGQGINRMLNETGSPDSVIVLRSGADSEMVSALSREDAKIIADAPGIARKDGVGLVSPELFVIINLPKRATGTDANVPFRGVESMVFDVRRNVEIVEGRMFGWGKNEIIVGRGALAEFAGLALGKTIEIGKNDWEIVGIFEANGGLEESELWADGAVLGPAYNRGTGGYQTLTAKLSSSGSYQQFEDALSSDPRLFVKAQRLSDYYAEQGRLLNTLVTVLGAIVGMLMGLGALFGALNTMYTAVSSRSREIATLKALGFGASPVVVSVIIESMILAVIGGTIGALLAWAGFDGYRAATMNWQSFSQITFAFDVNVTLLAQGIIYALGIGLVGGLFPAIRAARLPIAVALRE